jgi:membrane-associated phospholipid phosphatase
MDNHLTKWIYQNIGLNSNPIINKFPFLFGLVPYEIYILPGMFLAIALAFYYDNLAPIQIHLLPHWAAYSISVYIKSSVHRLRPGCNPALKMNKLIDPKHCEGKTKFQSFPSGHTIIAFSLATSLILYLDEQKRLNPQDKMMYDACIVAVSVVAVSVSIHRISYGYHHVSDVIIGAIIGIIIGYLCYKILDPYVKTSVDKSQYDSMTYKTTKAVAIGASLFGIAHFFMFKFQKLSQLQH